MNGRELVWKKNSCALAVVVVAFHILNIFFFKSSARFRSLTATSGLSLFMPFMYIALEASAGSCRCRCIIHTDAVILSNWTHEARVPGDTLSASRRPALS